MSSSLPSGATALPNLASSRPQIPPLQHRFPVDDIMLKKFSGAMTDMPPIPRRIGRGPARIMPRPARSTGRIFNGIFSNHLTGELSKHFSSRLAPPPGCHRTQFRLSDERPQAGDLIMVRRFQLRESTWAPPNEGILREKRVMNGIMTTYEVYDVEFCDEAGGRQLHFYSSITGEIANKDGQFPVITERQAWQNYLAHTTVYAFLSYEPHGRRGKKRPAWTPSRVLATKGSHFKIQALVGPLQLSEIAIESDRLLPWNSTTKPALMRMGYDILDEYGDYVPGITRCEILGRTRGR